MKNARAMLVMILVFGFSPGQAEVYKWVDEHGRIHYGDKPHENAETVSVKEQTIATESPDDDSTRREYRQRVLKSMQHERERLQEQRAQTREEEQKAQQQCAEARRRLADITNAGFLYQENAQGERMIFTDEQRAQATAQAEAAVKRYCGN